MKNKTLLFNIFVLLAFLISIGLHFKKDKIAYVDSIQIIQNYKGMKEVQVEIKKMETEKFARVDTLKNELEGAIKDYEKKKSKMSSNEIKLTEEILYNKQKQLVQFQQATEQKINEEKRRITQQALTPIDSFIKEYGKKHGYSIIFGATVNGNILYADKSKDITEIILNELNK